MNLQVENNLNGETLVSAVKPKPEPLENAPAKKHRKKSGKRRGNRPPQGN